MNRQEIFDRVVTHLANQNKKSMKDDSYQCLYRAPNGLKCALGALIADENYIPVLEGEGPENGMVHNALVKSGIDYSLEDLSNGSNYAFLRKLQIAHDSYPVEEWPEQLKKIAKYFGLDDASVSNSFPKVTPQ